MIDCEKIDTALSQKNGNIDVCECEDSYQWSYSEKVCLWKRANVIGLSVGKLIVNAAVSVAVGAGLAGVTAAVASSGSGAAVGAAAGGTGGSGAALGPHAV